MSSSTQFTRRDFLKTGAAGSACLVVGFYLPGIAPAAAVGKTFAPNAFIEIDPNGEIRLWVARSEMGQGPRTSMTMILAEELDADWSHIKIMQADFDPKYGDQTTGGSQSVRSSWDPLRKAGATARDMLVTAASQTWNVPKSECTTHDSAVIHTKSHRRLTYAALAVNASGLPVPKDVPLKDPKDYRIVGTKKERVDGSFIVIGEAHYGIDTKLPGMLYAVVSRPPTFGGRVKGFDPAGAQKVEGVRHVVEVPAVEMPPLFGEERAANSGHQHYLWGGVAVVADSTYQAIAGRRDEIFLVSKVLPSNASRRGTITACERSLKRLKTDRLDCYLLHWRGSYPLAETVAAFEHLVSSGKIRSWGVSNFDADDLAELLAVAGKGKIACNQVLYHLRQRAIEHAVIPWCAKHNVAVVAYSPFGHNDFPQSRSKSGEVLQGVATRHGVSARQIALGFLTRTSEVFAIPKASVAEHAADNAAAGDLALGADDLALLDKTFPRGPKPRSLPML